MPRSRLLSYPETNHRPGPAIDLTDREVRARLSGAALRAFFNIMVRWGVRDEDARLLLGGVTNGPYYDMKRDPDRLLDVDRLTRVSLLIGIFKALGVLHSSTVADQWVRLPNTNRIFNGVTPLQYMTRGGLPAIQTVRRLLDARRAG
ncbi:MAG: antitoxin Xre/MbcA/ParS toxin-binding domain-containing protein [Vicinamibacterales bacterium]